MAINSISVRLTTKPEALFNLPAVYRLNVTAKQRVVQERKRAVFTKSQVRRGVRYYEQAARPGSTPKQTMTALYDLIEVLRDYYDTDWDGMADALGVSRKSGERIRRLANKPELHLRHRMLTILRASTRKTLTGLLRRAGRSSQPSSRASTQKSR
jgi:hypothetical protein